MRYSVGPGDAQKIMDYANKNTNGITWKSEKGQIKFFVEDTFLGLLTLETDGELNRTGNIICWWSGMAKVFNRVNNSTIGTVKMAIDFVNSHEDLMTTVMGDLDTACAGAIS